MGCVDSKLSCSSVERSIMNAEAELGYEKKNCWYIDFIHRKYSIGGWVNHEQWRDISCSLLIQTKNTSSNTKIERFFSSIANFNGKLPLKSLLIIGFLLGEGTYQEKSQLFFDIYDTNNSKIIFKSDIHALVEEMLDIAINKIPILACKPQASNEEDFQKYLQELHQFKEAAQELIVRKFIGADNSEHSITLSEFQANFQDISTAELLSSHGLRSFVYSQKSALKSTNFKQKKKKSNFLSSEESENAEIINEETVEKTEQESNGTTIETDRIIFVKNFTNQIVTLSLKCKTKSSMSSIDFFSELKLYGSICIPNQRVFFYGGILPGNKTSADAFIVDKMGYLTKLVSYQPTCKIDLAHLNNSVYAFGGDPHISCRYNLSMNRWENCSELPIGNFANSNLLAFKDNIMLTSKFSDRLFYFDTNQGSFYEIVGLKLNENALKLMFSVKNRVYIAELSGNVYESEINGFLAWKNIGRMKKYDFDCEIGSYMAIYRNNLFFINKITGKNELMEFKLQEKILRKIRTR
ncbi:unnamed protein product [Blepharisma stoltei]|uniref:Uncharacterized protein n=1 Tax=Blepharisma stoltei TaxID=1481888 RepID=A0AAU9K971_9CILI|nr:unnamed protein product [Blepharisma stoltei]